MIRVSNGPIVRNRLHRYLPIVAVVMLLMAAAPALAGGKKSGSIDLSEPNPYTFGQQITFDASTENVTQPWVTARCYQNGELVYAETHSSDAVFTLGPTGVWLGGEAECNASLWFQRKNRSRVLDSVSFLVTD